MARYASPLNNGKTGVEGETRLLGKLLSGSGVLGSGDLLVSAQITPDMTVKVAAGDAAIFSGAIVYHGWKTDSLEPVNISTNTSGAAKIDAIVAYIDPAAASATENNPNGIVFVAVRGTTNTGGGTPVWLAPTSGEINTAIGSKPYIVLANVTVGNGVGSINSGNIADTRSFMFVNADRIGGGSAWATWSPAWNIIGGTTNIAGGGLYGRYKKSGRTVTGWMLLIYANDTTTTGGGLWFFSLPVAPVTNTLIQMPVGTMMFSDSSGNANYSGQVILSRTDDPNAAGKLTGVYPNNPSVPSQTADVKASTLPWAGGDSLFMQFEYEAAS